MPLLDENFRYAIQRIASHTREDGCLKTAEYYSREDGSEEFDAESAVLDIMVCAKLSGVMTTLGIKYLNETDKRKKEELKMKYRYASAYFYSECIDDKDKELLYGEQGY
ncbi:MAG: hypothetical protein DRM98_00105 [Thermoplasmata archaeon]|nr:MAG: hypothetical protein DRM98_00105 [Thermoplasmata archaeon]